MTPRIDGLRAFTSTKNAVFSDVWGVVHNGERVYERAVDALARFRSEGGHVVLITNSPRPAKGVEEQLYALGARKDAWDAIATSGDVTRKLIAEAEGPIYHLGPDRDQPLFDGIDVSLVGPQDAQAIVCTGLFDDESETPDDYAERLKALAERNVPFICANPDLVVERGERLIPCAGALAAVYERLGGETRVAGKPHRPIYELAMQKLTETSSDAPSRSDVLAIGDGMPTDVKGANDFGVDLLYISAGIHTAEYGDPDAPDTDRLNAFIAARGAKAVGWMPRLEW